MLSFSISYKDLSRCLYFEDTTERGYRGWKEAQIQGEDRVTVRITLLYKNFFLKLHNLLILEVLSQDPQSALHPCAMEFLSLLPKFRLHKLRQEPTQQQHKKEPQTLKTLIFYKSSRPQHRIFTLNHITWKFKPEVSEEDVKSHPRYI